MSIRWQYIDKQDFCPVYIARRFILWIISTTKSTNINIQRINDETRAPRVCDKYMSKINFLLNQRRFTERDVFSRGHKITIASSYLYKLCRIATGFFSPYINMYLSDTIKTLLSNFPFYLVTQYEKRNKPSLCHR